MIRISQIDNNFSIYKDSTVVLLGVGSGTKPLLDLMRYHKIDTHYICDNNQNNWGKVLEGIPVISPPQLQQLAQSKNNQSSGGGRIVVQIAINNISSGVFEQMKSIGVKDVVSFNEAYEILNYINKVELLNINSHMIKFYEQLSIRTRITNNITQTFNYFYRNMHLSEYLFIISIPKTGDNTLTNTFLKQNVQFYQSEHTPEILNKKLLNNINRNVKIIVGFREPISQHISFLYHTIANLSKTSASYHLKTNVKTFLQNGGDAQYLFDLAYDNNEKPEEIIPREASSHFINDWFDRFSESIFDLYQYPFDQEKGYTIIKEGNIEVFVYQLERMNDIVKEMSDWIGQNPFDKWVMGNEASGKWIANSYKKAQKEITFSQEYFDRCYNDPWIQHFYSQEDIEKFKERWRPHIKEKKYDKNKSN